MTLQEQYNNIKAGKGAKDVFLKHAKSLFPHLIPNHYGFDATTEILFQRQILNENVVETEKVDGFGNRKKESYELAFQKFLAEAKKNEKPIKADLKKQDKSVDNLQDADYDNTDTKNADNVIFDQYLRGIYTEMNCDEDLTLDKAKKIVLKNLTKDPIWYTKNSAFGIKNIGYTKELPGTPSADTIEKKDKMEVIDKSKPKSNVKDNLGKKEASKSDPKGIKSMTTTPKNSKGVKKMDMPGKEKIIKLKEGMGLADLLSEGYMGEEGDELMISPIGSNEFKEYVLEKPDGSAMVDMRFSSPEEATKYADKKGLVIVDKSISEGPLEDADAKLAKDQASKEAEAAAIEKQRADNKLKIANANKNV